MAYASVLSIIEDLRAIRIMECIYSIDGRIRGSDLLAALQKCSPDLILEGDLNFVIDGLPVKCVCESDDGKAEEFFKWLRLELSKDEEKVY